MRVTSAFNPAQLAITRSKLTIETLKQGVKYVQTVKTSERRHWRRSGWCLYY